MPIPQYPTLTTMPVHRVKVAIESVGMTVNDIGVGVPTEQVCHGVEVDVHDVLVLEALLLLAARA